MIDKELLIKDFFARSYEQQINEKILDDIFFVIPTEGILNYCHALINIAISDFLYYIIGQPFADITSKDLTQCSSFEACEHLMIEALLAEDNRGLDCIEIGQLFPQFIKTPNDGSWRKYGENQVKTANQLGLTFEYYGKWYLNCIGYVYKQLSPLERKSLLARNLLRSPLYGRIASDLCFGDVYINDYIVNLSPSTVARRIPNICQLLQIVIDVCLDEKVELQHISCTKPQASKSQHALQKEDVKFVCHKNVDKCFLTRGLTLPVDSISMVESIIGRPIVKGEPQSISVVLYEKEYICKLYDVSFMSRRNRCLQIIWTANRDLCEQLQSSFSDLYDYIIDAYKNQSTKGRIMIPDNMQRSIELLGIEGKGVFIIKCQN